LSGWHLDLTGLDFFFWNQNVTSLCGRSLQWDMHSTLDLKGLVHPKMKILSVFTHPHVVPNLYVFICSA